MQPLSLSVATTLAPTGVQSFAGVNIVGLIGHLLQRDAALLLTFAACARTANDPLIKPAIAAPARCSSISCLFLLLFSYPKAPIPRIHSRHDCPIQSIPSQTRSALLIKRMSEWGEDHAWIIPEYQIARFRLIGWRMIRLPWGDRIHRMAKKTIIPKRIIALRVSLRGVVIVHYSDGCALAFDAELCAKADRNPPDAVRFASARKAPCKTDTTGRFVMYSAARVSRFSVVQEEMVPPASRIPRNASLKAFGLGGPLTDFHVGQQTEERAAPLRPTPGMSENRVRGRPSRAAPAADRARGRTKPVALANCRPAPGAIGSM